MNGCDLALPFAYSGVVPTQTTCKYLYHRRHILMVVLLVGVSETDLQKEWVLDPNVPSRRLDESFSQAVCQACK